MDDASHSHAQGHSQNVHSHPPRLRRRWDMRSIMRCQYFYKKRPHNVMFSINIVRSFHNFLSVIPFRFTEIHCGQPDDAPSLTLMHPL